LRYAEDRDYPPGAGALYLSDKHLDQGLALAVAAGGDDVDDVIGDAPQGSGRRHGGHCGDAASAG
jgi:hypothetical protein